MTTGQQAPLPASNIAAIAARAAGTPSQGGGIRLIERPFAFDTPGLTTGAAVYTPTVGDILMDAWVKIDTAWDGTTPRFDFGWFLGGEIQGMFWLAGGTVGLIFEDSPSLNGMLDGNAANSLSLVQALSAAAGALSVPSIPPGLVNAGPDYATRFVPCEFAGIDPLKICVSQDGTNTGADPGSTQGAAVLFLLIATPSDE